jgi:signal transduction histidine kinase
VNRALLAEVTERRRAEQNLQDLNQNLDRLVAERTRALELAQAELREADRRKDAFIATLAHELRNPLVARAQCRADPAAGRGQRTGFAAGPAIIGRQVASWHA